MPRAELKSNAATSQTSCGGRFASPIDQNFTQTAGGTAEEDCVGLLNQHGRGGSVGIERLYLAHIVDSSNDAIVTRTNDGLIASWNKAAERMYGYSAEEVIGKPVANLAPSLKAHDSDQIAARLERGEAVSQYETTRRHRDGHEIHVSISAFAVRDAAGDIIGTAAIVQDITGRRRAEEQHSNLQSQLTHLSRWNAMGAMASSLAHELNQPLAAIANFLGAAQNLLNSHPDTGPGTRIGGYLEAASTQVALAGDIIRSVRRFIEKREAGRSLEDINAIIQEAISFSRPGLSVVRLETKLDLATGMPPVMIDRVQILQVLLNLVRNSIEVLRDTANPVLKIRTRKDSAGFLCVSVSDNGQAMCPQAADRLFEPFMTTKSDGMGLGLSICKAIVESHGGDIKATAIAPTGLEVSFRIPTDKINHG